MTFTKTEKVLNYDIIKLIDDKSFFTMSNIMLRLYLELEKYEENKIP